MRSIIAFVLCSVLISFQMYGQRKMSVTTSKSSYGYGETIDVRLRVWNDGDTSFTIHSSTTCVAWINPDNVLFSMICGFMEVDLLFKPGDSRTWIWRLVPSRYGYPTYSGRHCVWGVCGGIDSAIFDAPMFRGGPLSIKFYPSVSQLTVDSIRTSLNATTSWGYADTSGIFQSWQVSGFAVDSLADAFSRDNRVKFAQVGRELSPDSLVVTGISPPLKNTVGFQLRQNYPNPFNPTTTICYTLPDRDFVTLSIFNTLGQQVASLVNDTEEAGYHEVRFDGTGLASGVYFYRLRAGEYVETKKLIVVR